MVAHWTAAAMHCPISTGKLQIYVGAQRTTPWSWNHAKMVAVDGLTALLGGENLWADVYLEGQPGTTWQGDRHTCNAVRYMA